jgi:uncharacterized protein (TIGR03118 family)
MCDLPQLDALEPRRFFSATSYTEQDLVSDLGSTAPHTDTRLKNPWGLAVGPKGIEVADNGTGMGTMYDASGNNVVGTVRVPGHGGEKGAPTGVALNPVAGAFLIGSTGKSAQFVFVTENGTIDAWSGQKTDKTATVVLDNSAAGAVYKGAAIGTFKNKPMLYAADFGRKKIDVINSSFKSTHVTGSFSDPNLPGGFAPFNVTNIDNQLFVAFAKKESGGEDEVAGKGLGVVDVFGTDGKLIRRFASGGTLNAPWGIAKAPANFGAFSNNILVGNFGDGRVTAFKASNGARRGQLSNASNVPIELEGLWGIAFGNGRAGNLTNGLYFAAGTNDEANGLYGRLIADQPNPGPYGMGRAWHPREHQPFSLGDTTSFDELSIAAL